MFTATRFVTAKSYEQPMYPSTDYWTKKMWYLYIKEYSAIIKDDRFEAIVGKWIHLENIILRETNQTHV